MVHVKVKSFETDSEMLMDLYFTDFPTYHTAFDSYDWMTNYGDPLFKRHVAGKLTIL